MFSTFTRDLLRPEISNTLDTLLRNSASRDPFDDYIPSCGAFHRYDRSSGGPLEMFALYMNVKQFKKKEVNVKIVDGYIVVHAKHDESPDEHGFVCREFIRRFKIPDCVEPFTIRSVYNRNAVLVIKAPKKKQLSPTGSEKSVTVEEQIPYDVDAIGSPSPGSLVDVHQASVGTLTA